MDRQFFLHQFNLRKGYNYNDIKYNKRIIHNIFDILHDFVWYNKGKLDEHTTSKYQAILIAIEKIFFSKEYFGAEKIMINSETIYDRDTFFEDFISKTRGILGVIDDKPDHSLIKQKLLRKIDLYSYGILLLEKLQQFLIVNNYKTETFDDAGAIVNNVIKLLELIGSYLSIFKEYSETSGMEDFVNPELYTLSTEYTGKGGDLYSGGGFKYSVDETKIADKPFEPKKLEESSIEDIKPRDSPKKISLPKMNREYYSFCEDEKSDCESKVPFDATEYLSTFNKDAEDSTGKATDDEFKKQIEIFEEKAIPVSDKTKTAIENDLEKYSVDSMRKLTKPLSAVVQKDSKASPRNSQTSQGLSDSVFGLIDPKKLLESQSKAAAAGAGGNPRKKI